MNITIIGCGYVGLVTGVCFADNGNHVSCVDINVEKINSLKQGLAHIYEPGLEDLLKRNLRERRISFTNELAPSLQGSDICFLAVDTPPDANGKADLSNIYQVAESLGNLIENSLLVVTKSTVPLGTTKKIKELICKRLLSRGKETSLVTVASNPEFLKEGNAVADFLNPDRVIVGTEDPKTAEKLHQLYSPFMRKQDRFLGMDLASAELSKYAANAMLATRISFMNSLAQLAEEVGADIRCIRQAIGRDPRIGPDFLFAGIGYGGSCLPKDLQALMAVGREVGVALPLVEATEKVNQDQREWMFQKIVEHFGGNAINLSGKKIAVWGLSFKPNTDDIRRSPALLFIQRFLEAGVIVNVYDPVAMDNVKRQFENRAIFSDHPYDCLKGADALLVCTEWREFRSPDYQEMRSLMSEPVVFDGRNIMDPVMLRKQEFTYYGVGIPRSSNEKKA